MAHSNYSLSLEEEISSQSGMSVNNLMQVKTATGKKYIERVHDGMSALVADVSGRSSAGSTLITNMKSAVNSGSTADGENGLDNLPGGLKDIIKAGKMQGAVKHPGVNKGYYWVTGDYLYRFNNRNEHDAFQKALASKLTQTIISEVDNSANSKIRNRVKPGIKQIEELNIKSRTAATSYETRVSEILAGVAA
tara:strand:- start:5852 stop:6430 length:579 start_codon:yes stop_codon:yes gene_type:complete